MEATRRRDQQHLPCLLGSGNKMLLLGLATPFTTVLPSLRGLELHISWGGIWQRRRQWAVDDIVGKDDQKVGRSVGRMHLRKVISVLLGVFLYYYTHTTPWDELLLTWHGRKQEGGGCPNGSHWVLWLKVIVLGSLLEIKQMPVWQFKIECQVHQGIIDV